MTDAEQELKRLAEAVRGTRYTLLLEASDALREYLYATKPDVILAILEELEMLRKAAGAGLLLSTKLRSDRIEDEDIGFELALLSDSCDALRALPFFQKETNDRDTES